MVLTVIYSACTSSCIYLYLVSVRFSSLADRDRSDQCVVTNLQCRRLVSIKTLRPPSVRRWGMGEGKSLPHSLPYPSSCLSFTPSVELSFSLQSPTASKIQDGGRTFYNVSDRTKKSLLLCRLCCY